MDPVNFIRAIIFLIAALIVLIFPENVIKFQNYTLTKLHIKYSETKRNNFIAGIIFLIIFIILFAYSLR